MSNEYKKSIIYDGTKRDLSFYVKPSQKEGHLEALLPSDHAVKIIGTDILKLLPNTVNYNGVYYIRQELPIQQLLDYDLMLSISDLDINL